MTQSSATADDYYAGHMNVGPLVEPSPRWVRVQFGGGYVADSRRTLLFRIYGPDQLPTYYFPPADVRLDALSPAEHGDPDGAMRYWDVTVGDRRARAAAWTYADPPEPLADLKDQITFSWKKLDAWYEEEEEVYLHARDPYKRVDVMPSSRHVRVVVEGHVVADSVRPYLLFETGLPVRYYLPQEDVRMEMLAPTNLHTRCPYKGLASYWSVRAGEKLLENVVWSYPDPIPENPKIENLLCFFNERVDLYVDGELQEKPQTPWSR